MTITAKYPGKCLKCGGEIHVGDQIEWEKGKGASHTRCPSTRTAPKGVSVPVAKAARSAKPAPKADWKAPEGTEEVFLRNKQSRSPEYSEGATMWRKGEPWIIVSVRPSVHDSLDWGCCDGWHHVYAIAPITGAESETLKAARAEAEAKTRIERDIEYVLHDDMAGPGEYAARRDAWAKAQADGMTAVEFLQRNS